MSQAVAARLRSEPERLAPALARLQEQLATNVGPARWLMEQWEDVLQRALAGDPSDLYEVLEAPTEAATRLRPATPFAGVLDQEKRLAILHDSAT